ncbi:MAG TPA: cytochrome c3 family protein [Parafilimonas sp.]|nr:cytochrome c3 family protein [Parafilimonas sp.]
MKIVTAIALLLGLFILFYCCVESTKPEVATPPTYVGSEKCQSCHGKEYNSYLTSDHFHAMDSALPRSVKGDFNNSFFVYYGDTSFFYKKGDQYYVRTTDSTHKKKEFLISFTFGWRPLQQYLVSFPDGRIQALPFCWDTRPKEQGGQRWFHIYGKEKIPPGDELFWTGVNQNWNYMCADCHTTDYFKNFDVSNNTFHSSWSEDRVSCESCHGPASKHLEWTEKKYANDSLKGFVINLAGEKVNWKLNPEKGIAYPDKIVHNDILIGTCARCHARASRLTDYYFHGQPFLQTHIPSTINTESYYVDGQIKQEDYEYGSFLQSKMYAIGVTCINCHEPHTMQLKASGNQVCYSCHAPEKFDVPEHTHHQVNSTGAQCVNCHMPVTNYMVIDARRDHSIRIPRPDLSAQMNTPNACNKCHTDKSVDWAAKYFLDWYKDKLPPAHTTYAELMYAVSKNTSESEPALNDLLASKNYPAIIQATALERYTFYTPRIVEQIKNYLQSPDPNLRLNAVHSAANLPQETLLSIVTPLLDDAVISVRTEAMNAIAPFYSQLDPDKKQRFDAVMNEYLTIQRNLGDRPESYLNQGIVLAATGKTADAEQAYLFGLKRFPSFVAYYGNLADVYRAENNEEKAKEYLDKGLSIQPGNAELHYAAALWYERKKDRVSGLREFKKAVDLNPADGSFTYAYALALQSEHQLQPAIAILENYTSKQGNDPLVLNGLISMYQESKQPAKVSYYTDLRKSVYGY